MAELARLIGQTDPFGAMGRANLPLQPRARKPVQPDPYDQQPDPYDQQDAYALPPEPDDGPAPGPPSWMQRATRQETPPPPQQDYPSAVHPLHRYAAAPDADYDQAPSFADTDHERDLSRYDDALYGQLDLGAAADSQHDPVYADDAYGYQDGYDDGAEDEAPKRRGGMVTVVVVLALAVLGTGGAFAYRTYMGSVRSGEPPIIRADAGPTKVVPAPADGSIKVPDRMSSGDGTEKIVPREEAPVDLNARSGPRVVFPPLNQNGNPPAPAAVAQAAPPPANSGNGTLSNSEPRKIRTFSVRGDPADAAPTPATATPAATTAKPAATARAAVPAAAQRAPTAANASAPNASAPLSLSPQTAQPVAEPPTRVATTNPAPIAPSGGGGSGGYLVQVSSQKNEADAQASYRALQSKFPAVLGSREPVIKRADLGEKGIYYRAMVGPFGSPDEASQFCGSLKSAGGQCVVQRN